MVGKRVQFDDETWAAVDLLARDSMRDFQELADEAFRDLLAKHHRPVGLKHQIEQSVKEIDPAKSGHGGSASEHRRPAVRRGRRKAEDRDY